MTENDAETIDPTAALRTLCEVLCVDVDNLRHALADDLGRRPTGTVYALPDEPLCGDLAEYIDGLFDEDRSVLELMRLIEKACAEQPVWRVHGYFRPEGTGPWSHIDTVIVRAYNAETAGEAAREKIWDARLDSTGSTWAYDAEEYHLGSYDCPDGGSVRPE